MHPVQLLIEQYLILLCDLGQKALAAPPHDRLKKAHELGWGFTLQGTLQDLALRSLRHARRFQRRGDPLVGLHCSGDGIEQRAELVPRGEQRLRVVARDRDSLQRFFSALLGLSRYSVPSLRLSSVSRLASVRRVRAV